ncbi:MAG TPA: hypothetical protein VFV38_11695 [Ktedonobacteraceae bacterium]|nr:hypothetical protein [Ktedonobacteraceae bacterium]
MQCEEYQQALWKAGQIVPAGMYARVDDQSYHLIALEEEGSLPASFDGHTAWYCAAACRCAAHATRASQAGQAQEARRAP